MVQRTFLVTGASKGIGLALSKRLAAAGHEVVGIAREPLPSFPGTLVSVDLRDDKASAEAFVELAQRHSFDGVVNNAGVGKLQPLGEVDLAVVDQLMHFNLHSPINAVQAILPTLRQKGWGRIVLPLDRTWTAIRSPLAKISTVRAVRRTSTSARAKLWGTL